MRGETGVTKNGDHLCEFQSTPLMRGETEVKRPQFVGQGFQSTPLMRGETSARAVYREAVQISIHSPHARGDSVKLSWSGATADFNPLPSCEGRLKQLKSYMMSYHFNPLPSCEGRQPSINKGFDVLHFNPLPSCEGRPVKRSACLPTRYFNPLPSCEGRHKGEPFTAHNILFQSTPLMRGETA